MVLIFLRGNKKSTNPCPGKSVKKSGQETEEEVTGLQLKFKTVIKCFAPCRPNLALLALISPLVREETDENLESETGVPSTQ